MEHPINYAYLTGYLKQTLTSSIATELVKSGVVPITMMSAVHDIGNRLVAQAEAKEREYTNGSTDTQNK